MNFQQFQQSRRELVAKHDHASGAMTDPAFNLAMAARKLHEVHKYLESHLIHLGE